MEEPAKINKKKENVIFKLGKLKKTQRHRDTEREYFGD